MSRNRRATRCRCDLVDFASFPSIPVGTPGLFTLDQYFTEVFPGTGPDHPFRNDHRRGVGYGFIERNNGASIPFWTSGNGGWSNNPDRERDPDWTRHVTRYRTVSPDGRYRWARLDCPVCHTAFLGWYVQQPTPLDEPAEYTLYDTSFWYSFDDEPCERDDAPPYDPVDLDRVIDLCKFSRLMLAHLKKQEKCYECGGLEEVLPILQECGLVEFAGFDDHGGDYQPGCFGVGRVVWRWKP